MMLVIVLKWSCIALIAVPIWGTLLLHIRDHFIRPRFVRKAQITMLAKRLIEVYGPRAEEQAAIEEDYCWRQGDMLQQAVWKRVRRALR